MVVTARWHYDKQFTLTPTAVPATSTGGKSKVREAPELSGAPHLRGFRAIYLTQKLFLVKVELVIQKPREITSNYIRWKTERKLRRC